MRSLILLHLVARLLPESRASKEEVDEVGQKDLVEEVLPRFFSLSHHVREVLINEISQLNGESIALLIVLGRLLETHRL